MNEIRATVRLQFHAGFTLDDAERWVDYYAALGISHLYASPLQTSRSGSPHGYDGIDPTRIDPELGGEAALERLVTRLRANGMGLILDIVPNHVAVGGSENPWWQEVLAWGRDSPYAEFFDIDWCSPDPLLTGKLLVPFLGAPYAEILQSGELTLRYVPQVVSFHLAYHEHRFPIDPRHYGNILRLAEHDSLWDLAVQFDALQQRDDAYTAVDEIRHRLRLIVDDPPARQALDEALAQFDGTTPEGAIRLHALLERQHYRLAWWRTASDEINWRRFFDVTELGGLRVELPEVFEATHALPLRLVEAGWVDGLRVDHVDGLADPCGYCLRLRDRLDALQEKRPADAPHPVVLYVEKILGAEERLHRDWGVDGTSGYEFMNHVSGVQHDPAGAEPLRALWHEVSGRDPDFLGEVRLARREILTSILVSEYDACARALHAVARSRLESRDITLAAIRRALKALIAHFPIYRTYADDAGRPDVDEPFFAQAMAGARKELSPPDAWVLDCIDAWLGGEAPSDCEDNQERRLRQRAIVRFQQLTSPVAAKAVEDTAGYRSAVLISRNDVGFDGEHFSHSPEHFHAANAWRARHFPLGMVTTATHDHKRGEDVRARLAALSERAKPFSDQVEHWRRLATPLRRALTSGLAPSPGDQLIVFQLLLGAWPPTLEVQDANGMRDFTQRLAQWQQKALREAKLHSHWLWPDEAYEAACREFLEGLLAEPMLRDSLAGAARALDLPGAINGLAQTVLRLTVPGVPDLYQGCEFWDYSLVDPDNRRPVDHAARQAALAEKPTPLDALPDWRDGRLKQAVIARLLALRQHQPALFAQGNYREIATAGENATNLLAFTRSHAGQQLLVVVPRLPGGLLGDAQQPHIPPQRWGNTRLQLTPELQGTWREVLTHASLAISESEIPATTLLAQLPVGIFLRDDALAARDRETSFLH
ncbi:malto-oligosyltrehalose synthase [Vreelandella rituensis]|uniref:Malto-oligosyltrehalose synthase n=1 Tax=Vreelandella rituensis TaxID=2282306 RepID=A0A368U9L1_9GAMM|nr:malto-oligosyltrehalose synthase [Halomonas rituensis]RCV93176.1 malto-oligosyltrehalose synthase [Halomonas rituensis]